MTIRISKDKMKGLRVFVVPGFLLAILVILICFRWLDTTPISPVHKTTVTALLTLLIIFLYTVVIRKIYGKKDKK
jgi:hypothetical protein